jgi:hypothetical protein
MSKFLPGLMALLFLTACNDGGDTNDTSDTGDTNVEPKQAIGQFNFFAGDDQESCFVNEEGQFVGNTGVEVKIMSGDGIQFSFGSYGSSATTNKIPTHPNDKGVWAAPMIERDVQDGAKIVEDIHTRRIILGEWVCKESTHATEYPRVVEHKDSDPNDDVVDPYRLYLPFVGDIIVQADNSLYLDEDGVTKSGAYTSTGLHVISDGGMAGHFEADCWQK